MTNLAASLDAGDSESAPETSGPPVAQKKGEVSAPEFFAALNVGHGTAVQGVVTAGANGTPNDHAWHPMPSPFGSWAAERVTGKSPAYFTMAGFDPQVVKRYSGRTRANVMALRGLWIDVDVQASDGSHDTGYATEKEARAAVGAFIKARGLPPNFIVLTGSGGLHLHFLVTVPLTVDEWLGRARALVALCAAHGLNIDAQCTTDAARIMRAPGSLHQRTGTSVGAFCSRVERYDLRELDALLQYTATPSASNILNATGRKFDLSVNADVLEPSPAYSYAQAAGRCEAMRRAATRHGQDTPYPVWILALRSAALSTEGKEFAHGISSGHPDYDEAGTDKKLESLTGGPAGCAAWASAYGAEAPCSGCGFRGKLTNPAVQLGALVDTTPVGPSDAGVASGGSEAEPPASSCPTWVTSINGRFAVVRHGSSLVVVDEQTASMSGAGAIYSLGFLDIAGFRQMFNGRHAPITAPGVKAKPLASAWLEHPERRQYEGLAFAPGETLPANMLNMWRGFAVEPLAGDVAPWLAVLAALVPDETERAYVLHWLAWKIQNPGGVPDTILIFKGAKGTGKNSLFDPLIHAFGRHSMLADDPELIAGRFTWHLATCAFAVLDEAVFVGDPRQADRIKSRVTAKTMMYEQKGFDPVPGVNRCAFVMLTNHEHAWQATTDERRAVILDVGEALRGNLEFWKRYHAWTLRDGSAALLHYLQRVNVTGFNPRLIPRGEGLRRQVEMTALKNPAAAWWHQCLTEGVVTWPGGRVILNEDEETEIDREQLRQSFEASARGRAGTVWAPTMKRVTAWTGARKTRRRVNGTRAWCELLPPLLVMKAAFTAATQVQFDD